MARKMRRPTAGPSTKRKRKRLFGVIKYLYLAQWQPCGSPAAAQRRCSSSFATPLQPPCSHPAANLQKLCGRPAAAPQQLSGTSEQPCSPAAAPRASPRVWQRRAEGPHNTRRASISPRRYHPRQSERAGSTRPRPPWRAPSSSCCTFWACRPPRRPISVSGRRPAPGAEDAGVRGSCSPFRRCVG